MKHYGDITKINGADVELVDIITGGSPCQDLSVAGKRAGLAGARSGLFMEQIRIIKEMRERDKIEKLRSGGAIKSLRPRFMVWENVPGAFSSNNGEDFRAVLEETARVKDQAAIVPRPTGGKWTPSGCILGDGWSLAWRVHDAQFWGVPQRRKRIALVADFDGGGAPEILFERKGVQGDIAESSEQREDIAGDFGTNIDKASGGVFCIEGNGARDSHRGNGYKQSETMYTLNTVEQHAVCANQGYERDQAALHRGGQLHDALTPSEVCKTLNTMDDPMKVLAPCISYGLDRASFNQGQNAQYDFSIEEELAQTVLAKGPGGVLTKQSEPCVQATKKE